MTVTPKVIAALADEALTYDPTDNPVDAGLKKIRWAFAVHRYDIEKVGRSTDSLVNMFKYFPWPEGSGIFVNDEIISLHLDDTILYISTIGVFDNKGEEITSITELLGIMAEWSKEKYPTIYAFIQQWL